jgi:hypothetical protein
VTFYDNGVGDAEITGAIIAKFDSSDRLTLNAEDGATFEALSAATLGDPRVYVLDAYDPKSGDLALAGLSYLIDSVRNVEACRSPSGSPCG